MDSDEFVRLVDDLMDLADEQGTLEVDEQGVRGTVRLDGVVPPAPVYLGWSPRWCPAWVWRRLRTKDPKTLDVPVAIGRADEHGNLRIGEGE